MRIAEIQRGRAAGAVGKARAAGPGASGFGSLLAEGPAGAAGLAGPAAMAGVGGLLALQEADPVGEREARQRQRAEATLDELDRLQLAILMGGVPLDRLRALAARLAGNRERIDDPRLADILDQIELRAQVELAKWQAAADASETL